MDCSKGSKGICDVDGGVAGGRGNTGPRKKKKKDGWKLYLGCECGGCENNLFILYNLIEVNLFKLIYSRRKIPL